MTQRAHGDAWARLGRTLYDITQLLESAHDADERVRRVLTLLGDFVPYQACALLEARLGYEPRVIVVPATPPDNHVTLTDRLLALFAQLVDGQAGAPAPEGRPEERHLAVPLVGFDEVIGILYVRSPAAEYTEDHLRALSVVAAKLAGYVITLRTHAELAQLARERDEARRTAEAADRGKDEFLALISNELRTPLGAMSECAGRARAATDDPAARAQAFDELERRVQAQVTLLDDILGLPSIAAAGLRLNLPISTLPMRSSRLPRGERRDRHLLAGLRVLLVDHDLGLRESFQSVLEEHGAAVTAVASAPEALAALERSPWDVLLFGDLALRNDCVYDLMREVTARACPLPVASISAWRLEDRERARSLGFRLHLAKPLEMGALVDAVADLAGRAPATATQARIASRSQAQDVAVKKIGN